MPHGFCLGWAGPPSPPPLLVIAHVLSDLAGASPYLLLSAGVAWWTWNGRRYLPKRWVAIAVSTAAFLALCGAVHLSYIVVLVYPLYWAQAAVKIAMAVAAVTASVLAIREIPRLGLAQRSLYIQEVARELRELD